MIESVITDEFLSQILRFLLGSTVLLSVAWIVDSTNLAGSFRNRAFIWRTAVVASLLFLLPGLNKLAPTQTLERSNQQIVAATESVDRHQMDLAEFPLSLPGTSSSDIEFSPAVIKPVFPTTGQKSIEASGRSIFIGISEIKTRDWLLLLWGVFAAVALARLALGYRQGLCSLGRRRLIDKNDPTYAVLIAVCRKADLKVYPKLTRSCQTATPVTLLGNEICLPEWVNQSLSHHELTSILAHEVGHIKHRDLLMLMGLQLLVCVFFFQPLFLKARNRLMDIFEFLADESALDQCSHKNEVTEALINCADKVQLRQSTQWGFAMVGNTSRLKQRIETLNDTQGDALRRTTAVAKLGTILTIVVVVLLLPIFKFDYAAELATSNSDDNEGVISANSNTGFLNRLFGGWINDDHYRVTGDNHRWHWEEGEAQWEGELTLDYSGLTTINSISDQGHFDYSTDNIDPRRRIRFSMDDGELATTYWLEGNETAWDTEGRQWFDSVLVHLLRRTGIDARARVAAILDQAGPDAVIDELAFIDSDFVSRIYHQLLFENAQLNQEQIVRALETALSVSSDLEMRLLLTTLAETQSLSEENQTRLIAVAEHVSSDLEMRILLSAVAENSEPMVALSQKLLQATVSISSDLEQRLALIEILNNSIMNDESWQILRNVSEFISSDLELRLLLTETVERVDQNRASTWFLINATTSISSDLEQRLALSSLVANGVMNDENWTAVFAVSQEISSDLEARLLLGTLLPYGADSGLMTQLALESLSSISSDLEMRIAITSIIENGTMTEQNWLAAISQINEHISSKLERSIAFDSISQHLPDNDSLKARVYESMLL